LAYEPFFADFGPLNMGMTYRFVTELEHLLQDPQYSKFLIYHYTSMDSSKKANSAYLICAFQVRLWTQFYNIFLLNWLTLLIRF